MAKQTKLIDCGSTVFIYDFDTPRKIKEFDFEKSQVIYLQRLLLKNFIDDRCLATFTLMMSLNEYKDIQIRLESFINQLKESSGYSNVQYLAVAAMPTEEDEESIIYIKLVTNIEMGYLTAAVKNPLSEEDEEEYFSQLWGDEIFIDSFGKNDLLNIFILTYNKSMDSYFYNGATKIIFTNELLQPNILWNEEAETFIKNHKILDYPYYHTTEIFDKTSHYVIINEYSLF